MEQTAFFSQLLIELTYRYLVFAAFVSKELANQISCSNTKFVSLFTIHLPRKTLLNYEEMSSMSNEIKR